MEGSKLIIFIAVISSIAALAMFAGICKAVMDKLQFHFETSIFQGKKRQNYWNPALSWNNKNTISSNPVIKWLLRNPLVLFTDAWHLFGFLHILAWALIIFVCGFIQPYALGWYWWGLIAACVPCIHAITFHIFFTHVFAVKYRMAA